MKGFTLPDVIARRTDAATTVLAILLALTPVPAWAQDADFNRDGSLNQPEGYREWVYVGTPLTPNDMNGGEAAFPEFHSVYINPDAWNIYKSNGRFPDGTVLIKELVSVGSKKASSGEGYFMGEFIGLEAAVKDSKRFSKASGYWGYFSFGHSYPLATVTKAQELATCASCHQALAADDNVFTQYYPVLRAAKGEARKHK